MKKISLNVLFFLILVFVACNNNKESSGDKKETATNESMNINSDSSENLITFKVNKELIVSSLQNITRFDFGFGAGATLNVSSNTNEQPKTIILSINGDKPGNYPIESNAKTTKTPGVAYGNYMPDYLKDMSNPFSFINGEIVITSVDTTKGILSATFYGTAKRGQDDSVVITEGHIINGKLKPGITKLLK